MKEYNLNIDPRILELLGPSLYTNIYYVLAELIANAYDADAKNVYITANPKDITVEDDGIGMSYERGEVEKYLNVAQVSRSGQDEAHTQSGERLKMGRKGIGKLAALSVSENVEIITISQGEKSGFILTRKPESENKLKPIPDSEIQFSENIKDHGTSVKMLNPEYRLHKSLDAIKRNLLKIFPLVNKDFRIHIIRGEKRITIDDFDKQIIKELCALITLGDRFSYLLDLVPLDFPKEKDRLLEKQETFTTPVNLKNKKGEEVEEILSIEGWIGTYKTSRGRKAIITDFPDNFISLIANQKLGEFNVLPIVGQNKLNEVYVVGQLHINIFEKSDLPDMALSNRQGYKTDDPRYIEATKFIREMLLPKILKKREIYSDLRSSERKRSKLNQQKKNEDKLKKLIKAFKDKTSTSIAARISQLGLKMPLDKIQELVSKEINQNSPQLGFKAEVDSQKKKILISQTYGDKSLADIVYKALVYNNVPSEDILYTNCDDEVCRVPEGLSIYNYLRDFFVESYSTQKIYVLFITSKNTETSWGAITEVGASWITQIDHKIFNIPPFRPEHPLNDETTWHSTKRETDGSLSMSKLSADIFCQKIENVCEKLGYKKKNRNENKEYLKTLVIVE